MVHPDVFFKYFPQDSCLTKSRGPGLVDAWGRLMQIIVKLLAAFLHSGVMVSIQGPYSPSDNIFRMLYLHKL